MFKMILNNICPEDIDIGFNYKVCVPVYHDWEDTLLDFLLFLN